MFLVIPKCKNRTVSLIMPSSKSISQKVHQVQEPGTNKQADYECNTKFEHTYYLYLNDTLLPCNGKK